MHSIALVCRLLKFLLLLLFLFVYYNNKLYFLIYVMRH